MNKPKFKKGDEVVYHAGNWKYIVEEVLWNKEGKVRYVLSCNEYDDVCQLADNDGEHPDHMKVMSEDALIDYETWCGHTEKDTCKICCN